MRAPARLVTVLLLSSLLPPALAAYADEECVHALGDACVTVEAGDAGDLLGVVPACGAWVTGVTVLVAGLMMDSCADASADPALPPLPTVTLVRPPSVTPGGPTAADAGRCAFGDAVTVLVAGNGVAACVGIHAGSGGEPLAVDLTPCEAYATDPRVDVLGQWVAVCFLVEPATAAPGADPGQVDVGQPQVPPGPEVDATTPCPTGAPDPSVTWLGLYAAACAGTRGSAPGVSTCGEGAGARVTGADGALLGACADVRPPAVGLCAFPSWSYQLPGNTDAASVSYSLYACVDGRPYGSADARAFDGPCPCPTPPYPREVALGGDADRDGIPDYVIVEWATTTFFAPGVTYTQTHHRENVPVDPDFIGVPTCMPLPSQDVGPLHTRGGHAGCSNLVGVPYWWACAGGVCLPP